MAKKYKSLKEFLDRKKISIRKKHDEVVRDNGNGDFIDFCLKIWNASREEEENSFDQFPIDHHGKRKL